MYNSWSFLIIKVVAISITVFIMFIFHTNSKSVPQAYFTLLCQFLLLLLLLQLLLSVSCPSVIAGVYDFTGGECTNRPDSVKCSMCGQTVADDNDMNNHILEHEKSFWFFCALCDANFVEGSLLRLHVAKYHCDMTATSLKCWMCGMHFKLRGALSIHLKHCRRAPACVVCKGVLKNGRELEEHYQW